MEEEKSLKQYCKDAKNRLKHGFWQNYQTNVDANLKRAREQGISESKVREFYASKVTEIIRSSTENEDSFYLKVKKILDEEGEVSNVIGRLTDKNVYESMTYAEKQRYTLSLSEKYLKALERYKKEKAIGII
ncbi:MAG: hypothetical protein E7362_03860 [Clostridiales bacterium]|nr:hypothetical protein [Clostridiales bacterium]